MTNRNKLLNLKLTLGVNIPFKALFSSACHLEFVVALTRGVSRVVCVYFPLFVGKWVPDAHSFAIDVPSAFSLIGRAASSPGETCRGGGKADDYYRSLSCSLWDILCLILCHTCREGAVVERRSFILRPVKVIAGWHAQHQSKHMVRPQDAPLQHRGLWQGAHCRQLHLKDINDPVWSLISQVSR